MKRFLEHLTWWLWLAVILLLAAAGYVAAWTAPGVTTAGALALSGVITVPLALALWALQEVTE